MVGDMEMLFEPRVILLITLLGIATSMLLIALALRFGAKANIVLAGLYLIWVLSLNKIEEIAAYLGAQVMSASFVSLVTEGFILTGAVILAGAWGLMRRQQVQG